MEKFVAEVFGTAILVLLGDGVVAAVLLAKSKAFGAPHLEITVAWAFAVFCGVVIAGPISGAHLNPAVTLASAINGSISWDAVPGY
jgi:glycerol uptake facilitator protein